MYSESDNKTATLKNIGIIEEKMGFFLLGLQQKTG